jgi:hypothetical protein
LTEATFSLIPVLEIVIPNSFFFTHLLYIICRICNKCICSVSTGSWMGYAQWRNSYTSFCSLRYHFNSCIWGFTQVCLVECGRWMVLVCVHLR